MPVHTKNNMVLRKVLNFGDILGVSLPKEYANALGLKPKTYVQVYLLDEDTIVIQKQEINKPKLTIPRIRKS